MGPLCPQVISNVDFWLSQGERKYYLNKWNRNDKLNDIVCTTDWTLYRTPVKQAQLLAACYCRTRCMQHIFWEKNKWLITSIRNAFIFFPMSILWSTFGVLLCAFIFILKYFSMKTNLIYNHWIKLYKIF